MSHSIWLLRYTTCTLDKRTKFDWRISEEMCVRTRLIPGIKLGWSSRCPTGLKLCSAASDQHSYSPESTLNLQVVVYGSKVFDLYSDDAQSLCCHLDLHKPKVGCQCKQGYVHLTLLYFGVQTQVTHLFLCSRLWQIVWAHKYSSVTYKSPS